MTQPSPTAVPTCDEIMQRASDLYLQRISQRRTAIDRYLGMKGVKNNIAEFLTKQIEPLVMRKAEDCAMTRTNLFEIQIYLAFLAQQNRGLFGKKVQEVFDDFDLAMAFGIVLEELGYPVVNDEVVLRGLLRELPGEPEDPEGDGPDDNDDETDLDPDPDTSEEDGDEDPVDPDAVGPDVES